MSGRWQTVRLGDICQTGAGGTPLKSKKEYYNGGDIPWLQSGEVAQGNINSSKNFITKEGLNNSSAKIFPVDTVLVAMYGATAGQVGILRFPATTNQAVCGIFPNEKTVPEYLFYAFMFKKEELVAKATGNAQPNISQIKIKNTQIPLPSLEEQKWIVTILNETFEGIGKTRANAESNLANARDLFESSVDVIFSQKGKNWSEKKLGDIAYLAGRIGWKGLTAKEYTKKGPLFLSVHSLNYGDYVDFRDVFHISQERYDESPEIMLKPDDVLICKDGAGIGKMGIIKDLPGPATINSSLLLIRALEGVKPKYLYRALCSQSFQKIIKEKIDGATTPHLYQRDIRQFFVPLPPVSEQNQIIKRLDAIHAETLRLESIYQQKLKDLVELKQSLLEKAFRGELTTNNVLTFSPRAASPTAETTSPEFAAHVLAFGYHWHESQNRNRTYGHVKGQKFLHLAESVGNIDMGRQPIKDAAGPNDFQHMLRAKEWAESQKFFKFAPRRTGGGYDFKKLPKYSSLIGDSITAVKPYKGKLEKILSLLLPMNSQQAEILATVHAAWNNLRLDNVAITDDAIIHEARDNWHLSKMSIPETQFRKAIATIRNNGIIPDGTAKRVAGQENLF